MKGKWTVVPMPRGRYQLAWIERGWRTELLAMDALAFDTRHEAEYAADMRNSKRLGRIPGY